MPRFEHVRVGETGLKAYVPQGFPAFDDETSPDGGHGSTSTPTRVPMPITWKGSSGPRAGWYS